MRTNDENRMFKLYESTNRKKQMIAYIVESTSRNPWLFFDEQGPVPGATDPTAGAELGATDPTAGALAGGEDPEKAQKLEALQGALMDLTAEELIELMQKVVVAQQEAAAVGGAEGGEDPFADLGGEAGVEAPAGIPPTV
jgi:hypothetical protein